MKNKISITERWHDTVMKECPYIKLLEINETILFLFSLNERSPNEAFNLEDGFNSSGLVDYHPDPLVFVSNVNAEIKRQLDLRILRFKHKADWLTKVKLSLKD